MPNTATTIDYDLACSKAATNQGLDALTYLLDVAGVEYAVEQTGGMCMVVTVKVESGIYGVIKDADPDATGAVWLTCFYPGTTWTDGEPEDSAVVTTLDEAVALLATATAR